MGEGGGSGGGDGDNCHQYFTFNIFFRYELSFFFVNVIDLPPRLLTFFLSLKLSPSNKHLEFE